jgi:hypothetical protein
MSVQTLALNWGQRKLMRRFGRSLPWIGAAVAIVGLASTIRRKGVIGGTLDTALNTIPVVGGLKSLAETVRGRDFIRDRVPA